MKLGCKDNEWFSPGTCFLVIQFVARWSLAFDNFSAIDPKARLMEPADRSHNWTA